MAHVVSFILCPASGVSSAKFLKRCRATYKLGYKVLKVNRL